MSAAGMVPGPTKSADIAGVGAGDPTPNHNVTPAMPEAYGAALGNNRDIISVNDPLALANFLPGPTPPVVYFQDTPTWVYFVGGGLILVLLFKKGSF